MEELVTEPVVEAEIIEKQPEVEEVVEEEEVPQAEPVLIEEIAAPVEVAAVPVMEMDYPSIFSQASDSLKSGDLLASSTALNTIIQSEQMLTEVITLVRGALDKNPYEFSLWMSLGDAYGRNGELQKALDAYIKAEEYLH